MITHRRLTAIPLMRGADLARIRVTEATLPVSFAFLQQLPDIGRAVATRRTGSTPDHDEIVIDLELWADVQGYPCAAVTADGVLVSVGICHTNLDPSIPPLPPPPIALAQPVLDGNERAYVNDVLDTTRLSMGPYVEKLERAFATQTRRSIALACSSGTAALHLAMLALDLHMADLVLMPALSYVATANAVAYGHADPVFCDIDPETWQMDLASARQSLAMHTSRIRAIIAVDLYGGVGPLDAYRDLAAEFRIPLIIDAAESIGATVAMDETCLHVPAGSVGDVAIFSLFGNKTVTCGEGGVVVTDNADLAAKMRKYRGQGQADGRRYFHDQIGYNYRLSDLQAAVAVAQMERLDWQLERRREVAAWYAEMLPVRAVRQAHLSWTMPANWMQVVKLPTTIDRDLISARLADVGIETRPAFVPLHLLPMYRFARRTPCPNAEIVGRHGLCLPTHARLTRGDVERITTALGKAIAAGS